MNPKKRTLSHLTLRGFKSIRELEDFQFESLNLIVGANGAGKSNLIDFFRMVRAMAEGGLQEFITRSGGGDGFFFNGPKETRKLFVSLSIGRGVVDTLEFALEPTADSGVIVTNERASLTASNSEISVTDERFSSATIFNRTEPRDWRSFDSGGKESILKNWKDTGSSEGKPKPESYVYDSLSSWTVFHVHDTSFTAPLRRDQSAYDFRELRPDCSNIAPFLHRLRREEPACYERIRETVQIIAPFFDDFLLEPRTKGKSEMMSLQWRQKGSTFPFQPWQFSDGTIRFICLAAALLQPVLPSTIVIDEPELGLHPVALQALAALLHETSQRTQLVVSTQSAPLLDHFDPEHVIVAELADGASVFRRLQREELSQWLDDYSLGALVRGNIVETGPRHG